MGDIHHLSDIVIDQIAAGEIIERPSSVVKELLENSIDSGASQIILNLKDGGISKIEVSDDGKGISKEDLPLSIARHATSKISSISDLNSCNTHGFRGEALASISSVSKLTIISRKINSQNGLKLEKIDDFWQCSPSAAREGTNVIVEDLFHNLPARKKFLKSKTTELSHCKNIFNKIALIHEKITWYLFNDGKEVLKLPAEKIPQRFSRICGVDSKLIHNVKNEIGPVKIRACFPFSNNEIRKKNHQFIFVNERSIKDKSLSHAIRNSLEEITHGNHEMGIVLSIQIPNSLVDFNVHPSKNEVRFRDQPAVYKAVHATLKKELKLPAGKNFDNIIKDVDSLNKIISVKRKNSDDSSLQNSLNFYNSQKVSSSANSKQTYEDSPPIPPLGFALAQLLGIYILSECEDGLIIVDMHAAHERILFEKYKREIQKKNMKIQKFITPLNLSLTEIEKETVEENENILTSLGFVVKKLKNNNFILEGISEFITKIDAEIEFMEILYDLMKYGEATNFNSKLNKYLGDLACKNAVKANKKMSIEEMNNLLRLMEKTEHGGKCNHGRPAWTKINLTDVDRLFLRGR